MSRRRQFRRIPPERLSKKDYFNPDPNAQDKTYSFHASVIDGFEFDWKARRIPYSTFRTTDIAHWLAMDVALKAVSDAGYSPENIPGENTRVIVGNSLTGDQSRANAMRLRWPFFRRAVEAASKKLNLPKTDMDEMTGVLEAEFKSIFPPANEDSLSGGLSNTIAGRICNYLNLNGGGYTVDGACSSSLLAVATASSALACGEIDMAIVGGVDVSLDPFELVGFAKARALAQREMKVYDRNGEGFLPGEGCGFIVLKRHEDAVRENLYTYAVVHGWGVSSDGGEASLMAPDAKGQLKALERAYFQAPFGPSSLSFIEGHGTGTPAGDAAELESITLAMKNSGKLRDSDLRPCGVTSVKSVIGHTKAAAGMAGVIKTVLALNQRVIPPTAACSDFHPAFEKNPRKLFPVIQGIVRQPSETLRAGVSSMGFGGINCHVALSSADAPSSKFTPSISAKALLVSYQHTELVALTAPSVEAMAAKLRKYAKWAEGASIGELADLASQAAGEINFDDEYRCCIISGTPEDLSDKLQRTASICDKLPAKAPALISDPLSKIWYGRPENIPRVGMLFPGQGSQKINMARVLSERFEWAERILKNACRWISAGGGNRIDQIMFRPLDRVPDSNYADEWFRKLSLTENAQPAICAASVIWKTFLEKLGVEPVAVGGHSLGELAAFWAAGVFDQKTLFGFSTLRGQALSSDSDAAGGMAVLRCPLEEAEDVVKRIRGYIVIANVNSPKQVVISGDAEAVEKAIYIAEKQGVPSRILPVSNAFHSLRVQKARRILKSANIPEKIDGELNARLFSSIDGNEVAAGADLKKYFSEQVVSRVDFVSLVRSMAEICDVFVEVGPGRVLSDLITEIQPEGENVSYPVESRPGDNGDLSRLVARLFTRGVRIDPAKLFENRLIKPFVPAHKKVFIQNPCEKLDAFNCENLSREAAVTVSEGSTIPSSKRKMYDTEVFKEPEWLCGGNNRAELESMLFSLIEDLTGFAKESLSPELRLLEDLNLDSIKAGDLLVKAWRKAGIDAELAPLDFANANLSEILNKLELSGEKSEKNSGVKSILHPDLQTLPRFLLEKPWVRYFTKKMLAEPLGAEKMGLKELISEYPRPLNAYIIYNLGCGKSFEVAKAVGALLSDYGGRVKVGALDKKLDDEWGTMLKCSLIFFVAPGKPVSGDLKSRIKKNIFQLSSLAGVLTSPNSNVKNLTLVEFGGGYLGTKKQSSEFECCCLSSFVKSLHLERPNVKVRLLDFSKSLKKEELARITLLETFSSGIFVSAGYDQNKIRRVPSFEKMEPIEFEPTNLKWTRKDVMLVTGGAKGISSSIAFEISKITGAKMALLGSTSLEGGEAKGIVEIRRLLDKYDSEGLMARYFCCDVTDGRAVSQTVAKINRDMGPVSAVIHGAAVNKPRPVSQVSIAEAYEEIAPKVIGAVNIIEAICEQPVKLFAGFSSIIAHIGMPGNAWYGFSNEAFETILKRYAAEQPQVRTVCAAYSIWKEEGMGARMGSAERLKRLGIGGISSEEGVKRFVHLFLNDPGRNPVIITSRIGGIHTWKPKLLHENANLRFLEIPVFTTPEVESVFKTKLTLEKDLYLKDHYFRGSYLFPAVFGLEAMAQAAAFTIGAQNFGRVRVENIRFRRPISVDPDFGAEIIIHALAREKTGPDSSRIVETGIFKANAGAEKDFFSATFIFGLTEQPAKMDFNTPGPQLEIQPEHDLYRHNILFQGPAFQRIQRVLKLEMNKDRKFEEATEAVFEAEMVPQELNAASSFDQSKYGDLLLGDPYFRDTLLQAGGLLAPQKTQLPFFIRRLDIYSHQIKRKTSFKCAARLLTADETHIALNAAAIGPEGEVVENLEGCKLKALKRPIGNPTPEELVNPAEKDNRSLQLLLGEYCKDFSLNAPVIGLEYIAGIHDLPSKKRHEKEIGLLRRTIASALSIARAECDRIDVIWTKEGKPILADPGNPELNLSVSHDDRLCLCTAGFFAQGCDTVPVTKRNRRTWEKLIGKDNIEILDLLINGADSLNTAGARIWSVMESVKKASGKSPQKLYIKRRKNNAVLFYAETGVGRLTALTTVIHLTWGPERIIAMLVNDASRSVQQFVSDYEEETDRKSLFPLRSLDNVEHSAAEQASFVYRVPVTFKPNSPLSGKVYFSNYFLWLGEARETAIWPILKKVREQIATGEWGLVTNSSHLRITGEATARDEIEIRLWASEKNRRDSAVMDLSFDFLKVLEDGGFERLAWCEQQVSWVRIISHGVVKPQAYPSYYWNLMKKKLHPPYAESLMQTINEPLTQLHEPDWDEVVYRCPPRPIVEPVLFEKVIDTSTDDSNLVGNIYFTNYYSWQGRVRDQYLYNLIPEYFRGGKNNGEMICLDCSVKHLREAMPFDRIVVTMALKSLRKHSAVFYFEYFRLESERRRVKLAYGQQHAMWVTRDEKSNPVPTVFPVNVQEAFLKAISKNLN